MNNMKQEILDCVLIIPEGKVTSYGEIAKKLNLDGRTVGQVLTGLSDVEMSKAPWYRVVAGDGYISSMKLGDKGELQKNILIREGYTVIGDKVDAGKHMWSLTDDKEKESLF